ncbi:MULTISPECIES: hypothetical protein [Serratia]|uniref:hypothetical protein n=1 Tax=Serratia TaxID=613 RepID=UPI001F5CE8E8|nr:MULTISPECIES: hypothetical protein [Serratia]
MRRHGGKRPDFIIESDEGSFILLDAKYHSTDNCSVFILTDCEIGKYRSLQDFLKTKINNRNFEVIFMLFPKEKDGKHFTFVYLDEFNKGELTTLASKDATRISLKDRDDLWFTT